MSDSPPGPTRFVILAAPRTGSNWLCSLLNSHPDILCHHEIFNPEGVFYALDCRDGTLDLGTIEERNRQPLHFLGRLWQHPLEAKCVGFKMTRGQDERVLQAVLDDRAVRKILLRRHNALRTYVSEAIARRTGRWEVYDRSELKDGSPRVHVAISELLEHLELNQRFYGLLERALLHSGQHAHEVWYEQLLRPEIQSALLWHLDVPARPLVATSVKQNPGALRRLISNYDELRSAFSGSEFEPLLEANEDQHDARGLSANR